MHRGPMQAPARKKQGYLKFSDGTEYRGEIVNGKANGFGRLSVPNGTRFEGEF